MDVLEQYYMYLNRLFRIGGILDEMATVRRHYENLTANTEVFRLKMRSGKYFSRYYLGGRTISECCESRIEKELGRMAENIGVGGYEGLLYDRCMSALIGADECAHKLKLETLKKPSSRKYWKTTHGKRYPIKEYEEFIMKYTFCKNEMNCLGKIQECYVDSYGRSAMRRRLDVMQEYELKFSIHEMETLDRRELEKAKRRAQHRIRKEA